MSNTTYWRDVMNTFGNFVENSMSGQVSYDDTTSRLRCVVKKSIPIEFNISIFRSSKLNSNDHEWAINSFSLPKTTFVLFINITLGDMKQFELIEQQMMNNSQIKQLISTNQIDSDHDQMTLDLTPRQNTVMYFNVPVCYSVCCTVYLLCTHDECSIT